MRIRQADDLSGVAWVGENFLVSGEAGIENDFAAAARDRAGRAAVKYAPVFQRECGGSVLNFVQCVLRRNSFRFRFRRRGRRERAEMIDGPIREDGAAVNEVAGHRAKHARIVGADAVIAHHKVAVARHALGRPKSLRSSYCGGT